MRAADNAERLVLAAQLGVIAAILGQAALIAVTEHHRALFLLALTLIVFVPFAVARLVLHRRFAPGLPGRLLWTATVAGLLADACMVGQLLTTRTAVTGDWLRGPVVTWIGPVWFSAHGLFFVGDAMHRAVRGVMTVGRGLARLAGRGAAVASGPNLERRDVLRRAAVLGAAVPFGVSASGVPLSFDFRVEEYHLTLPHWPAHLDGLRIAHLSDIHVGPDMDRTRLAQVAELTNACRADLILHSGDFLTHRLGGFDAPLYEALRVLRAPLGQWACLGNHDYDDAPRLVARLRESGVTVLRDEIAVVPVRGATLEIAGLDYVFRGGRRAESYAATIARWMPRSSRPRIVLNHDPSAFYDLPAECADLVLSGHTHGGHVGVQLAKGYAISIVPLFGYPDQGVYDRGDMRLFVTRCVGFYGYPIRIGIPPEIALLTLHAPRPGPA